MKLALALIFVVASQSLAQTAVPERFKQLDEDNRGTLTLTEVTDNVAFTIANVGNNRTVT
jgi:hypothetical protein